MIVNREVVAGKILDYLQGRLPLPTLVDWAEHQMMDGDWGDDSPPALHEAVARLGLADVKDFGLLWDDCLQILARLGYRPEVQLVPA